MELSEAAQRFNHWLDSLLDKKGWTDYYLATQAGISHAVLNKARHGILPKMRACDAIAKALEIDPMEIFYMAGLTDRIPVDKNDVIYTYWAELPEEERKEVLDYILYRLEKIKARENKKSRRRINWEKNK